MKISPTVVIDGETITPPGWMWVFAFAIRGIKWALEEVEKPEFREEVRRYVKEQKNYQLQKQIDEYLERIEQLREQLL